MVLRKVDNGRRFMAVLLGLAVIFVALGAAVPAEILIQVLNGLFFGAFVTVIGAYGPILLDRFFGGGSYDRVFHYSLTVAMQWAVMLASRATSVWTRILEENATANNNLVVAATAYVSIVAIIWQTLVLTEGERHERQTLFVSIAIGGIVAIVLIALQRDAIELPAAIVPG